MPPGRIFQSVVSNWLNLVVSILVTFYVAPILVHSLGTELYGVWSLITAITGYFTLFDFGVNTAIIRFISRSTAVEDHDSARGVFSTSLAFFALISALLMLFSLIFGFYFPRIFDVPHLNGFYLYAVFIISALDLSLGLLFSVFTGTLSSLQEFTFLNGSSIFSNLLKSAILVLLLNNGWGLLTVASLQVGATILRSGLYGFKIRKDYPQIHFSRNSIRKNILKQIYAYSIYSFIIAIALKLLFYTDSVVIGSMIGVAAVTYYAISSSFLDYLEKFVWGMVSVFIPVISSKEALGDVALNTRYYTEGTRYALLLSLPFMGGLYYYGDDFIRLWMGNDIAIHAYPVLKILVLGYTFSFSQLMAHAILKGVSKHKTLAYIMALEALANLLLSVALARNYGIAGVAVGTTVPLIIASLVIGVYTCRVVGLHIRSYLMHAFLLPIIGLLLMISIARLMGSGASNYIEIGIKCSLASIPYLLASIPSFMEFRKRSHYAKE